jgi:glucose 1-dehydrogenase
MRAITAVLGQADSVQLDDVAEAPAEDGPVLVETLAIGVCGTDVEIVRGDYGAAVAGRRSPDPRA